MTPDWLLEQIKQEEDLRLLPYHDSLGNLTVGYGHNLSRPITRRAAGVILEDDLEEAERDVAHSLPWTAKLNEVRRYVLVDMAFNVGLGGLLGFHKMLWALEAGDYTKAAKEMLDSTWARQVGDRAAYLAKLMKEGTRASSTNH